MADVLIESGKRGARPTFLNELYRKDERTRQENIKKMHALADQILAERKANPQPEIHDLLNTMIYAVDTVTGEKLTDEMIRFNMCTFLVSCSDFFQPRIYVNDNTRLLDMKQQVPRCHSLITIC